MSDVSEISVFVDESGSFVPDGVDTCSPYYLLCMVFHNQGMNVSPAAAALSEALANMGLDGQHAIHAGPLIRREDDYARMPRENRIGIFRRMMIFMQKIDFRYRCFKVFKPYSSDKDAVHGVLLRGMRSFLVSRRATFDACREIKVYYDNGQAQVTALLAEAFSLFSSKVRFVPDVSPNRYRLFQVADAICTLELIRSKLEDGGLLTRSEERFFGGVKSLKKLYFKPMLRKRWE